MQLAHQSVKKAPCVGAFFMLALSLSSASADSCSPPQNTEPVRVRYVHDGDTLVFVGIKTRRNQPSGLAKEAVHKRKQAQLSKAALVYMKHKNLWGSKARFDVVAIGVSDGKKEVEIIQDAFELAY